MNFNLTNTVDYKLQGRMTDELISLYGILVKLLLVTKINKDDLVFGDFSHIKTDSTKSFELYALPETSESWDNMNINFTNFGMSTDESASLFVSRKSIDKIFDSFDLGNGFESVIGNIIILPNSRIMEITDLQFEVPGVSNLYSNNDTKNVYKISLKTYNNKIINETPATDINAVNAPNYETLDNYFNQLIGEKDSVDNAAEVTVDTQTTKTVIDSTEDSVFGRF